jgi:hypothetical protein
LRRFILLAAGILAGCGGGEEPAGFAAYHVERQVETTADEPDVTCGPPALLCPYASGQGERIGYAIAGDARLDGSAIDRGSVRADGPRVLVTLTADGAARFRELSRDVARAGLRGEPHHLAIVVGDEIVAAPTVDPAAYPDGIDAGGGLELTVADDAEAARIAESLRGS